MIFLRKASNVINPFRYLSSAGRRNLFVVALVGAAAAVFSGCQTVQEMASDRFSLSRQDNLVLRIEDARDAHLVVRDQLAVAKEAFGYIQSPGEESLRQRYETLSREYVGVELRMERLRLAAERMEEAARSYFMDWERRIYEYVDPVIRSASRQQLDTSRGKYEQTLARIRQTEEHAQRVVDAFGDQVRFLRHNLNREAVEALRNPSVELQLELDDLMEKLDLAAQDLEEAAYLFRVE